jgi:plasmid replication initiation protein
MSNEIILPISKTIHKKNEIIRGEILIGNDKNNVLELNPTTIKLFNLIYMFYQTNYEVYKKMNNKILSINLMSLKNELEINSNNYNQIIRNSIKELFNKEIKIKNFIDDKGNKIIEYNTHFIKTYKILKAPDNNIIFNIEFDDSLFEYINNKDVFFTELKYENYKKLNRGHQIRLYEFLKSYENMKNNKTPQLNLKDLNKIFSTNLQYIAHIEKILKRSLKKINEDTDLKIIYEKSKNINQEKTIQFIFKNNKTKENKFSEIEVIEKFLTFN